MNCGQLTYTDVSRAVLLKMRGLACTGYGLRPSQVVGIYYKPERDDWYATVEIYGDLQPLCFKVKRGSAEKPGEIGVELINFFVPGPSAPYTTWINPDYVPFAKWN